jgi:hypothetical protein
MGYDSAKTPSKQPTTTCVCPTHCNTIITPPCPPVYPQHFNANGLKHTLPGLKIRAGRKQRFSHKYQNVIELFHANKTAGTRLFVLDAGFQIQTALACFCLVGVLSSRHNM